MIINKKFIRSVENYLGGFKDGETIRIGLSSKQYNEAVLRRIGFTESLDIGEKVLPSVLGRISRFNAEGKELVDRSDGMETAYRQQYWEWKRWDGTPDSRIVDVPYRRYPRISVPPPSEELSISTNKAGVKLVVSRAYENSKSQYSQIKHSINLFLELFGECEVLPASLEISVPLVKAKRLNWNILPKGSYPWEILRTELAPILRQAKKGKIPIIEDRLKAIGARGPEQVMTGNGGFSGYVIFSFPKEQFYILESAFYGNATYVLEKDWERISQLTKAEILSGDLHRARIVHSESWHKEIEKLFTKKKAATM